MSEKVFPKVHKPILILQPPDRENGTANIPLFSKPDPNKAIFTNKDDRDYTEFRNSILSPQGSQILDQSGLD